MTFGANFLKEVPLDAPVIVIDDARPKIGLLILVSRYPDYVEQDGVCFCDLVACYGEVKNVGFHRTSLYYAH